MVYVFIFIYIYLCLEILVEREIDDDDDGKCNNELLCRKCPASKVKFLVVVVNTVGISTTDRCFPSFR